MWNTTPIDLSQPFDISFWMRINGGADGITFTLQNAPGATTLIGTGGGGIAYMSAASPGVTVEWDIYDNGAGFSDIPANHIAIHTNGGLAAIAGPVPALASSAVIGDNICRKADFH